MLLKRRDKQSVGDNVRGWLWPRRGWKRSFSYAWQRVKRLSDSPHAVALGFACGAFASFTPFMGFHFIIGFLVAAVTRSNMLASAFGTFVGNPLTFPFIWYITYSIGKMILGADGPAAGDIAMPSLSLWAMMTDPVAIWQEFFDRVWPVFMPMLIGGIPVGLLFGAVCYLLVRWGVGAYQSNRRLHLEDRRESEQSRQPPPASRDDQSKNPLEMTMHRSHDTPEMVSRNDG